MMVFSIALKELGARFRDRLTEDQLKIALDYADFNEEPLALETLCDCLCESNVKLTPEEYIEILKMDAKLGLNLDKKVIIYMKNLIR
jgi:hypothetical protein